MKDDVLDGLHQLRTGISDFYAFVKQANTRLVNPANVEPRAFSLCRLWAEKLGPRLSARFGIASAIQQKYQIGLSQLFKLSAKRNLSTSHLKICRELMKDFDDDLITPVLFAPQAVIDPRLNELIEGVPYPDQKGYLGEALRCLESECDRAATVLGWSAAMHHMHCKIEEVGFDSFNKTVGTTQKKGRFRGLDGMPTIQSISDLRETPDRKVLLALDAMDILESNQRQRLEHCLDMRIQCSHPGDAPMTPENLLSFFSDLSEIVFKNQKLAL